jgi:hypothetical protein
MKLDTFDDKLDPHLPQGLKNDLSQDLGGFGEHSAVDVEVLSVFWGMGDDILNLVKDVALYLVAIEVVYGILCCLLPELLVLEQLVGYHKTLVVSFFY